MKQLLNTAYLTLLLGLFTSLSNQSYGQLVVHDTVTSADLANTISGAGVTISNVTLNCNNGAYGTFDASASNVGIGSGILLTTGLANTPTNACAYNLSLYDTGNDGWACGHIEVYQDGVLIGTYTETSTWGSTTFNILVTDGASIEIVYVTTGGAGCDENEHSFELMDANWNIVANVGGFGTGGPIPTGSQYTGTVNCTGAMGYFGAPGPNSSDLASWDWGQVTNDPDLITLDPDATNDVCILEFDILPTCDTMKIDYVFASEEYPNFVGSFNDAFGFFLTGPNPAGGNYTGQNIATIPGTGGTPVTINNVNNGPANAGPCANCAYYVNNGFGDDCWNTPQPGHCTDSTIIRYNGMTVPMTAEAPVVPCQTYHMKIAIADVMDHAYDSGVFLAYQGLNCPNGNTVQVAMHQDQIIEGCQDGEFDIIRIGDTTVPFTVDFQYLGSATSGTDYTAPPTTVTFPVGDTIESFTIPGIYDGIPEGTETITIVASYTLCSGTLTTDTIELTIVDEPILNFTPVDENCGVCDGEATVDMTPSTAPLTYTWDAGTGNQTTQTATNLCPGTYSVTVVDANGCTSVDSTSISSVGGPPLGVTTTDETCLGLGDGIISYTVGGSAPVDVYLDGVLQTGGSPFTGISPGTYTVLIIEPIAGCQSDTVITINAGPCCLSATTSTTDETCNGQCDGTATVDGTANAVGSTITYNWLDANGTAIGQTTATATGLCSGTYQVEISDSLCTITETVNIGSPVPVTISASNDTTICLGGAAILTATGNNGTTPYSYTWSNGLNSDSFGMITTVDSTVTVYATDANGCISDTTTVNVTVNPPMTVTVSNDTTICAGSFTDLSANALGGDGGPYTYTWSDGTSVLGTGNPITVTPSDTTTYYVVVTDGCETPAMGDSILVSVEPAPDVQFSSDTLNGCVSLPVQFTNDTDPASVGTVLWDLGDGTTSTDINGVNHVYNTPGCYDVSLTVTSNNGCSATSTVTDMICAFAIPVPSFVAAPQPTTLLDPRVFFTNTSIDGATYQWNFAEIGGSTEENPSFEFPSDEPGTYNVCLEVTSANGCVSDTCMPIVINSFLTVYAPNAFTPDGDGLNDIFYPVMDGFDPDGYEFLIFNRWGELLWTSETPGEGWNGTYKNGDIVPEGVYVWKLRTKEISSLKESEFIGHITVIK